MEYIQTHYSDSSLNVNALLDTFKVSASWLAKKFRQEVGMSASEYLLKYRLEKSKELLATDITVSQIVEKTGFSSNVAYYRMFKKHEGMTPTQYRELNKRKKGI